MKLFRLYIKAVQHSHLYIFIYSSLLKLRSLCLLRGVHYFFKHIRTFRMGEYITDNAEFL